MADVNARPWFVAGYLHLLLAAALGVVAAAPSDAVDLRIHVLLAGAGLFLVGGALAHGFLSPFVKREHVAPSVVLAPLVAVLAADAGALLAGLLGRNALAPLVGGYGVAFLLLPLHVLATAAWGRPWRGGVALFAKDQPFRVGDALAGTMAAVALAALAASAILGVAPPRGLPTAMLLVLLLGFVVPFFAAVLVFLLPRNAKRPMPGATLVGFALAVHAAAVAALAIAFARPAAGPPTPEAYLYPAAGVLLAHALALLAFLRLRFPKPGPQLARARPFLQTAAVLAGIAPVALVLALLGGPNGYLPLAAYAFLALGAALAAGGTLLGAPILLNAVPREGRWGAWSGALGIAGLFLLSSTVGRTRPVFPAALLLAAAAGLLAWGLAPMRAPRRECPP